MREVGITVNDFFRFNGSWGPGACYGFETASKGVGANLTEGGSWGILLIKVAI